MILTNDEYRQALAECESLMSAEEGTSDVTRLLTLGFEIEVYEAKHYPIPERLH